MLTKIRVIQSFGSATWWKKVFKALQVLSIVLVHALVSSFLNSMEWFTVKCWKSSSLKELYALQQSDIIVVPGLMLSFIIFTKVSAFLLSTHLKKQSFVSRSIPPKTQTPFTLLPLWYLRLPNLLSSISTIWPTPPICFESLSNIVSHTSLQKLYQ